MFLCDAIRNSNWREIRDFVIIGSGFRSYAIAFVDFAGLPLSNRVAPLECLRLLLRHRLRLLRLLPRRNSNTDPSPAAPLPTASRASWIFGGRSRLRLGLLGRHAQGGSRDGWPNLDRRVFGGGALKAAPAVGGATSTGAAERRVRGGGGLVELGLDAGPQGPDGGGARGRRWRLPWP